MREFDYEIRAGTSRALAAVARNAVGQSARVAVEEPLQPIKMPRKWWQFWRAGRIIMVHGVVEVIVMTNYAVTRDAREACFRALEESVAAGIGLQLRFIREVA